MSVVFCWIHGVLGGMYMYMYGLCCVVLSVMCCVVLCCVMCCVVLCSTVLSCVVLCCVVFKVC